jgi:hypothetical protein
MNFTLLVILWSGTALLVLLAAIYRKLVTRGEDNIIHLNNMQPGSIEHQTEVAHKVMEIDRVGQFGTAVVALGGLGLAAAYLYDAWQKSAQLPF